MKILICGDSFAADWTIKYTGEGWPNLLANIHDTTNIAQAGCSEYKIYLQLCSVQLNTFDAIIISHTSPFRIPVKKHPVHWNDLLHNNCDLIYADIKEHSKSNTDLYPIIEYFEKYFDEDNAKFVHNLICKEIETILCSVNCKIININNFDTDYNFKNMINFLKLTNTHVGLLNHFDNYGNQLIFQKILEILEDDR